jgi:hypothetical protein
VRMCIICLYMCAYAMPSDVIDHRHQHASASHGERGMGHVHTVTYIIVTHTQILRPPPRPAMVKGACTYIIVTHTQILRSQSGHHHQHASANIGQMGMHTLLHNYKHICDTHTNSQEPRRPSRLSQPWSNGSLPGRAKHGSRSRRLTVSG